MWLFKMAPSRFWDHSPNVKYYMKWLVEKLGIEKMEDWYDITYDTVKEYDGQSLLRKHGGLIPFLSAQYPGLNSYDLSSFNMLNYFL
jgi:hypothetical protein